MAQILLVKIGRDGTKKAEKMTMEWLKSFLLRLRIRFLIWSYNHYIRTRKIRR